MVTRLEIKRNVNQMTDVSRVFAMSPLLITNAEMFAGGVRNVSRDSYPMSDQNM